MRPRRYIACYVLLVFTLIVFTARLVNLQVANGSYYREKSTSRTTRSIELIAPRGEILDRNGRAIVTNRTGYNVYILKNNDKTRSQLNRVISNLFEVVSQSDSDVKSILPIEFKGGKYFFTADNDTLKKWKKENDFDANISAQGVIDFICQKYEISESEYSPWQIVCIGATHLDMKKRGFSTVSPYLFAENALIEEVSIIKEQTEKFSDISIITQPVRHYPYVTLGAHMLGRVGLISAQEYENNKGNGYNINSNIGKDGIEKYMEEYLRGENGSGSVEQTAGGFSVGENVLKAPVNGRNISLTIDLDMQVACEKALQETIGEIASSGVDASNGADADAGSMVVIDVNTGAILAMASYPSYNIENFGRIYNEILQNPANPLFNRAIAGNYAPASTFKILVAAGALEEGIITPEEQILDTGKYTYFKDYQPGCWIYNQTGGTHGYLNVSQAIRDSCNVFFFETGRKLTIEKINEYASRFGFGQNSGIELKSEERTGVVASPENRKAAGGIWYPGDTCQTAIGQSDTLVTPLQLANYIATIANGGTRYRPHLIKSVENPEKTAGEETKPEVLDKIPFKEENLQAIVRGMRMVVTDGTADSAFANCKIDVAAKTGSAQASEKYTNGICVAYAPYEKPTIAIACVIEKAGSGARTAKAVRKVIDSYFDTTEDKDMQQNVLIR